MPNPLEEWYLQLPPFTRIYTTGIVLLTLALQMEWVTPFQLFYTYHTTFVQGEYWRLATSFLFLGGFSLDWVLNVYFIVRYCRDLEEGSYLNRPADFVWMVFLMCIALLAISPYLEAPFLGDLLVASLTYMWSRHYSYLFINFMGLFTTSAAYLPWILVAFSSLVENRWPTVDLVAISVGHVFWFLSEEWPRRVESGGVRVLKAPRPLCKLMHQDIDDELDADADAEPLEPAADPVADPANDAGDAIPERTSPATAEAHEPDQSPAGSDNSSNAGEPVQSDHASTSAVQPNDLPPTLHQRTPYSEPLSE
ncbi:hypothetical protein LPJ63_001675 [Coemansia sp. RSA 2711]|nr:hypothetical protein LPJ63_001675 [Coemansia sp. RSA 2711]